MTLVTKMADMYIFGQLFLQFLVLDSPAQSAARLTADSGVVSSSHITFLEIINIDHFIIYGSFTIFENSAFLEDLNTEIEKFKSTQSVSNMNFSTWNALFLSVLNKHAPIKGKHVKRAKKSTW